MKKLGIFGLGFFFILAFCVHSMVSADTSGMSEKDQIHKDVALVLKAEKNIQINRQKVIDIREKLDNDILVPADHLNLKDLIRRYRAENRAYRDEALDAINDMHSHWASLTQDQRELVDLSPDEL